MKGTSRKTVLTQTTKEYASRSSIHGISYLFDLELGIADRLLWFFLVLAFSAVAAALTWNLWIQWRNQQVKAFMYKIFNSRLNHPSIVQALLITLNQTTEYSIEIFCRTVTFHSQITLERPQFTSNHPQNASKSSTSRVFVGPTLKIFFTGPHPRNVSQT